MNDASYQLILKPVSVKTLRSLIRRGYAFKVSDNIPHLRYEIFAYKTPINRAKEIFRCLIAYEEVTGVLDSPDVRAKLEELNKAQRNFMLALDAFLLGGTTSTDIKIEGGWLKVRLNSKTENAMDLLNEGIGKLKQKVEIHERIEKFNQSGEATNGN